MQAAKTKYSPAKFASMELQLYTASPQTTDLQQVCVWTQRLSLTSALKIETIGRLSSLLVAVNEAVVERTVLKVPQLPITTRACYTIAQCSDSCDSVDGDWSNACIVCGAIQRQEQS